MATCGVVDWVRLDETSGTLDNILTRMQDAIGVYLGGGGTLNPPSDPGTDPREPAYYDALIKDMISLATDALNVADPVRFTEVELGLVDVTKQTGSTSVQYSPPTVPSVDDLPEISTPGPYDPVPTFTATRPTFTPGATPSPLSVTEPTEGDFQDATRPTNPGISLPALPTLDSVSFPTISTISVDSFTAQLQDIALIEPTDLNTYDDDDYSSALLTKLQTQVQTWLAGGVGFPDSIWLALRQTYLDYIDRISSSFRATIDHQWNGRGWQDNDYVKQVRQQYARQHAKNAVARFHQAEHSLEERQKLRNLQDVITNGIALEQLLVQIWDDGNKRLIAAALAVANIAVLMIMLRAKIFNARAQQYKAKAQAWRIETEAKLKYLDGVRAEIEAQMMVGKVNLQEIENYASSVEAAQKAIQAFDAEGKALEADAEVNQAYADQFDGRINAFLAKVRAYASEWEAFSNQVRADNVQNDFYNTLAQAFASEIRAHTGKIEGEETKVRTQLRAASGTTDTIALKADVADAEATNFIGALEESAGNALLTLAQTGINYDYARVKNQRESTYGQLDMQLSSEITQHDQKLLIQKIKEFREQMEQLIRAGEVGQRALAQIGAASWQAVNLSMTEGVGFSSQQQKSCTWSIEGN